MGPIINSYTSDLHFYYIYINSISKLLLYLLKRSANLYTLALNVTYFQTPVFIVSLVRIVKLNITAKHLGTFSFL